MPIHTISGGYANTYLIQDGDSFVAVDVGTSCAAKQILNYFTCRSIDPSRLKIVTATHFHIDHVGGISRLAELFPEMRVCLFSMVEYYLSRKHKICLIPPLLWLKGLVPVFGALEDHIKSTAASLVSDKVGIPLPLLRTWLPSGYKAECILREGQPIPHLPHWDFIETPGHTDDSVCLYHRDEQTLISGDTILNLRGSGELNTFCCDAGAIRKSFDKLSALPLRDIFPGHGRPLVNVESLDIVTQ